MIFTKKGSINCTCLVKSLGHQIVINSPELPPTSKAVSTIFERSEDGFVAFNFHLTPLNSACLFPILVNKIDDSLILVTTSKH
jgi:hypothetical protein